MEVKTQKLLALSITLIILGIIMPVALKQFAANPITTKEFYWKTTETEYNSTWDPFSIVKNDTFGYDQDTANGTNAFTETEIIIEDDTETDSKTFFSTTFFASFNVTDNCVLSNITVELNNLGFGPGTAKVYLLPSIWNATTEKNEPHFLTSVDENLLGTIENIAASSQQWYTLQVNQYLDNSITKNNTWFIGLYGPSSETALHKWYYVDDAPGGDNDNESYTYEWHPTLHYWVYHTIDMKMKIKVYDPHLFFTNITVNDTIEYDRLALGNLSIWVNSSGLFNISAYYCEAYYDDGAGLMLPNISTLTEITTYEETATSGIEKKKILYEWSITKTFIDNPTINNNTLFLGFKIYGANQIGIANDTITGDKNMVVDFYNNSLTVIENSDFPIDVNLLYVNVSDPYAQSFEFIPYIQLNNESYRENYFRVLEFNTTTDEEYLQLTILSYSENISLAFLEGSYYSGNLSIGPYYSAVNITLERGYDEPEEESIKFAVYERIYYYEEVEAETVNTVYMLIPIFIVLAVAIAFAPDLKTISEK